ncbi:MAG: hypothetical protein L3K25_19760 [Gammaproteobacteria bacterium]|nr:hypothetical protein [Gammaproteobacteria bacterium]
MPSKTIVILANSLKHSQHCVAGKCIVTKKWLRPVADARGSELSHAQVVYENPHGKFTAKPKQKIIIGLGSHAPLPNQPENYIVDNSVWQQNYSISDDELRHYLDMPDNLWGEGDRVPYPKIVSGSIAINQSLYLIKVDNLSLYKNQHNKRRAKFDYKNISYDLAATDPQFDNIANKNQGLSSILCISLGENFEGNCYKLIATIF